MIRFETDCPIAQLVISNPGLYQKDLNSGLFQRVVDGLSARMSVEQMFGHELTDDIAEQARQYEIAKWQGSIEGLLLKERPEVVKAVYECEKRIKLGNCALYSEE